MGTLRFTDLQTRSVEVLDLTSLTLDEFRQLVPPHTCPLKPPPFNCGDWPVFA